MGIIVNIKVGEGIAQLLGFDSSERAATRRGTVRSPKPNAGKVRAQEGVHFFLHETRAVDWTPASWGRYRKETANSKQACGDSTGILYRYTYPVKG